MTHMLKKKTVGTLGKMLIPKSTYELDSLGDCFAHAPMQSLL